MAFQLTPQDWLMFGGVAVTTLAFLLIFNGRG